MISKNRIKFIHSLERRKERKEQKLFVAEGPKLVGELLTKFQPQYLAATQSWLSNNKALLSNNVTVDEVTAEELCKASLLQHPQEVIALFPIPENNTELADIAKTELVLALDGVQDPGNIGTIVRLASWFGIHHVFCSEDCADIFNPKATQATMGAIAQVAVHYINLPSSLSQFEGNIYGTHLDGNNIYKQSLSQTGVIVMGNEGKGVSTEVSNLVTHRLYIPPYPADATTVESLNVAIATAIVCAEFRRNA